MLSLTEYNRNVHYFFNHHDNGHYVIMELLGEALETNGVLWLRANGGEIVTKYYAVVYLAFYEIVLYERRGEVNYGRKVFTRSVYKKSLFKNIRFIADYIKQEEKKREGQRPD